MKKFKNLQEALSYFKNEEVCRDYLEKMRWPDGRIVCPICGVRGAYRNADMKTYKCRDKDCKTGFSVTVGTLMENTKLPLAKWFAAMYMVTGHKRGVSSCQLARDLGIGQKAAWFLLHRVREMVKDKAPLLLENVVEIDETYVGGKFSNMRLSKRMKMHKENLNNKTAVMGMVERKGNARLTVIGGKSFKEVVIDNVKQEAILVTDAHLGYEGLANQFGGHQSVNHQNEEFVRGSVYTNTVEGFFSHFKRMVIGTYYQISPKHLQRYCNEQSYRFNTRDIKDVDRFNLTFTKIEGRLTYNQLIEKRP